MDNTSEQDKLLAIALQAVRDEAFQMKRNFDKSLFMESIKSCSQMLSELRTSALSPKNYYRLYIDTTNELHHLELFLLEEFEKGQKIADLYELVQYAGSIIPRLYLLITVGVVYIKTGESSRKDILKDLVEMCRGVQHPLRGLFLRNYLLQCTRSLLPDQLIEGELSQDGNVRNAVDFVLTNFCEMNKLWVRMQHQGPSRDRERREKERHELRILVGTNLVRLSQLENLDCATYIKVVLPSILEQIVGSRDHIAQEYLMECLIQVFSDEFHVATLDTFLKACAELNINVDIRNIIISLIERYNLFLFVDSLAQMSLPSSKFYIWLKLRISDVIQAFRKSESPLEDAVAMHVSLLNLSHKCYTDRNDYVDHVFRSMKDVFESFNIKEIDSCTTVGKDLINLLKIPVEFFNDVSRLLEMSNFHPVLNFLDYEGRCKICSFIAANTLDNVNDYDFNFNADPQNNENMYGNSIKTVEKCELLLNLLQTLIKDDEVSKSDGEKLTKSRRRDLNSDVEDNVKPPEEFHEEQVLTARLINLMFNENADKYFLILNCARKHFGAGGRSRFKYTLPPLVFSAYKVAALYRMVEEKDTKWEKKLQKVFQFCHQTISALIKEAEYPDVALRLFLQGALALDKMPNFQNRETTAYEYFSQALSLYEDEIGDSKAQLWAITLIIGTLQKMTCFTDENLDPLRTQCVLAASKLFKKPDQSRGVVLCSHLFWPSKSAEMTDSDAKKAMECIKKSVKIAGQCMDVSVQIQLYTEILNDALYLYEKKCPQINIEMLNQLLSKITENMSTAESSTVDDHISVDDVSQLKKRFLNTQDYLRKRKHDQLNLAELTL
uniref:Vacuolar protein sorting-associated protein 35 n=1 Tax=Romanomermis culicivorax TaxID=13658 RepID=A0A915IXN9_ROMCU